MPTAEELLSSILRAPTDFAIIGTDLDFKITLFNRGAEDMLGYTAEEVLGVQTPDLFWDPADAAGVRAREGRHPMEELEQDGRTSREWTYIRKDGSRLQVLLTVNTVRGEDGEVTGYVGVARPLAEEQQLEAELIESHERFLRVFNASPVPMLISRMSDGMTLMANPAILRLLGHKPDEFIGRSRREVGFWAHSERREELVGVLMTKGRITAHEDAVITKDGLTVPVLASLQRVELDGQTCVVGAFYDITERKETELALESARELATAASRAKSEFLSRMSHELRTPLNAILGFGQLLELEGLPERQTQYLGYITKAGKHLLALIDEVLDISRIESGQLRLSIEPVHVQEVVREALDMIRPVADRRGVSLPEHVDEADRTYVLADRQRLKQVLLNLLSNAVKYNREGGAVRMACRPVGEDQVRLEVIDTGIGIPEHDLERLFTAFERLHEERNIEGTGLGLALSKRLVEAMEGEMGVSSEVGVGSRFWIELNGATPYTTSEVPAPTGVDHAERTAGPSRKVLCIEDNLSNVRLVEQILAHRPEVELQVAMQGRIGLELAREHVPSLVLVDLNLPDISGDEVLRLLRADRRTAHVPVVVVSADATPGAVQRLRALGATDFLTKPFEIPDFLRIVDETAAGANGR